MLNRKVKSAVRKYCKGFDVRYVYLFWVVDDNDFEGGTVYHKHCPKESGFRRDYVYCIKSDKFYTIKEFNLL